MPRPTKRHLAVALGAAVALVCAWFVGHRLADDWPAARHAMAGASVGWLVAAVALSILGMLTIASGWHAVLDALGHRFPTHRVLGWFFAGEIGKYVPGGIWPILGRGELARRAGVPRPAAYSSVALSLALLYLASALVACALLPFALDAAGGPLLLVLLLPPLGLAALHPGVTRRVETMASRVLRRPTGVRVPGYSETLVLVARYVPVWLLVGGATWSIAHALDPDAGVTRVLLATCVSWLAGFLAVPVPGGVGVREAVFVGAVGPLAPGVAESTAVLARVALVGVDAVGAVLGARAARR